MLCRYYLKIGVSEIGDNLDGCLDCTEMICNSDDIEVSYKRTSPFGGVVRKCTSSIVFCNEAKDLIYQEYLNNYLNAKAAFALYTINNDWTYSKEYECPLDFSSLQYEGNTIEMNTIDQSVAAIIKANKSVKYEFPVSELKSGKQLYYDRLLLTNVFQYILTPDNTGTNTIDLGNVQYDAYEEYSRPYKHLFLPIYHTSYEDVTNTLSISDQYCSGSSESWDNPIGKSSTHLDKFGVGMVFDGEDIQKIAIADGKNMDINGIVNIKVKYTLKCKIYRKNRYEGDGNFRMSDYIRINFVTGRKQSDGYFFMNNTTHSQRIFADLRNSYEGYINTTNTATFGLMKDDIASVVMTVPFLIFGDGAYGQRLGMEIIESHFELTYSSINTPEMIDVINPKVLLNSILSKFNIKGRIDTEGYSKLISKTLIVAAESIRNIAKAKIYTSFSDFAKWMEVVFGFIYEIEAGEIVFKHRNRLFSENIVMDMSGHVGELSVNIDNSNIYSIVRVGYNKQDYESINGRDEFRFANEYITGVEINENKLELISPYRADAYGFEFLCQKRGESTTDNRSDKDIFFIDVTEDTTSYQLDRSILISGVINPASMFNQAFAPSEIVRSNDSYIGVFSNKLMFSSSEGNSGVLINGVFESSDIELNQSLATVGKLKISSDIQKLPEGSFIGLFTFVLNGYRYTFYLDSVDFRYQREQQSTIEGIIKFIEKL